MNRVLENALAAIDRGALVFMLTRQDFSELLAQPGVRPMLRMPTEKRHPPLFHGVPVCVHDDKRQVHSWVMCTGQAQPTLWRL